MTLALQILAAALILGGLLCAILPTVPGIPIMFIGIWLLAGVDGYRHLGCGWLIGIAVVGALGICIDLAAGVLDPALNDVSKQLGTRLTQSSASAVRSDPVLAAQLADRQGHDGELSPSTGAFGSEPQRLLRGAHLDPRGIPGRRSDQLLD